MLIDIWRILDDTRTCQLCRSREGSARAHGQWGPDYPAHANCRCTLEIRSVTHELPIYPPEPPEDEKHDVTTPNSLSQSAVTHHGHHVNLTAPLAPSVQSAPQSVVSRRYACTLLAAGELRGHGLKIAPDTLEHYAPMFDGLTAFVDHTGWQDSPRVERIAGVFANVYYDLFDEAVAGELVLKDTPAAQWVQRILDELVTDTANGEPALDVGLSADCWVILGEPDPADGLRPITGFVDIQSVDIVFRPASDGARFERILASAGPVPSNRSNPSNQSDPTNPTQENQPMTLLAQAPASLTEAPGAAETVQQVLQVPQVQQDPATARLDRLETILAQLAERTAVAGFDRPRDVITASDPIDQAQAIVDWMFGVRGATAPDPEMRSPRTFYRALTGDLEWRHRFDARRAKFANATTTTLADLAANAMNKVFVEQWNALPAYRWWEDLTMVQPNNGSVQAMAWVTFGGLANLPSVAQGGTYTELTVADAKESDSFTKYGAYVGITEEMWRNDDLQRLQTIPRALAVAALRTRSANIAAIFTVATGTGPTLDDDSTVLFHSNHSNIATTALSIAAWKAARLECYKHAELGSSKRLGIWPRYLLVPGDLYDDALVIFGYGAGAGGYPGTGNNDVNPYALGRPGDPRPEIVAVPDWTDSNDWGYLADPAEQPVLMISYANAPGGRTHPMPEVWSVTDPTAGLIFTNDVLPVKVRDWYAYGVATYRGIGKRNVT